MASDHSSCFSLNVLFVGLTGLLLGAVRLHRNVLCTASFSMELMHRDHPESPLDNTTSTASGADYLRGADSVNPKLPFVNLLYLPPTYAVNMLIGQGDKRATFDVSFAGRLSWICCIPCKECYHTTQHKYRQTTSNSYHEHEWEDEECTMLNGKRDDDDTCEIEMKLKHPINGYIKGTAASDRMGISMTHNAPRIYLNKTTLGCIHKTVGDFHEYSLGMIDLGPGPLSFVSQLRRHSYEDIFSYCLPSLPNELTKLYFGSFPNMPDTVSTTVDTSANSYIVTSASFLIGGADYRTNFIFEQKFVMDPTYYFTYVSRKALDLIISEVKKRVRLPHMSLGRVDKIHELCLDISPGWNVSMLPKITFKLANGAPFVLNVENAFERVDEHAMCLTILSNEKGGNNIPRGISIFGSRAQLNKRIGIHITGKKLSFHTEYC